MLHGQTTMPPVRNEPLAMPAAEVAVVVIVQPAPPRRRRRFAQHVGRVAEQFVRVEGVQPHLAVQLALDHLDRRPG